MKTKGTLNVAIVGRANVGKSTLFNRIIKKRRAIESPIAGTTRDRISERVTIAGYDVELTDTGGLQFGELVLEDDVRAQAGIAIDLADIILFVVSAIEELTVNDFAVADLLRKSSKPVILIVNKCDNEALVNKSFNMYELGFGKPVSVSSAHSRGIDDLKKELEETIRSLDLTGSYRETHDADMTLALVGRPNVGKSSFFNTITGERRAIVSDIPGTTRDELDTLVQYGGKKYLFKDTAGIRRRGKREHGLEGLSVIRSFKALSYSDIALLLIDYSEGITKQDLHVAEEVLESGKGVVIVVNKADLMEKGEEARDRFVFDLQRRCAFMSYAPVVFVSAKTGKNVEKVFPIIDRIHSQREIRISTPEFNGFIASLTAAYKPHGTKSTLPKIYYCAQIGVAPPHFVFFTNNPDALHFSYKRYIENKIREKYGFEGTPIIMDFRGRESGK